MTSCVCVQGPLEGVFRVLQGEYSKALGLDDKGSSSDEEGDDKPDGPVTPSKIEKLTGSMPSVLTGGSVKAKAPRNLRLERSESTVGWVKPKARACCCFL